MRILLLPLAGLFWLITSIRNLLYSGGILKSYSFGIPVISVGNLSTGGTGKSPMIIYLIQLLSDRFEIATLSRGYGRKSKGFKVAGYPSKVAEIGDEPLQFFQRFKTKILVTVGENRVAAIQKIVNNYSSDLILMDDAFQHRRVKPGFSIVLTTYQKPFFSDYLLPAGNLRESIVGKKRADVIVVTKCPPNLSEQERKTFINKIKPSDDQAVFFSGITYSKTLIGTYGELRTHELADHQMLAITGIADSQEFSNYICTQFNVVEQLNFGDHHNFSAGDIEQIEQKFSSIKSDKKLIITTEKDYMRLKEWSLLSDDLYYLAIETFIENTEDFERRIFEYVGKYKRGQ